MPWVKGNICLKDNANSGISKEKNGEDLTNDAKEAILSQNSFDDLVFEFAAKFFEEQLQVASSG